MRIDYVNIDATDLIGNPPNCQCGSTLTYSDKLHKLICENPNCLKTRMTSVLSTLQALDNFAKSKDIYSNLVELAKADYDRLVVYVETCEIKHGAELITSGKSLEDLGQLGAQLGTLIDTMQFEINDLCMITGSSLLSKFKLDILKLTSNQRQAVLEINTQLGIDGTIWLSQLLFEEYCLAKNNISNLTNYLTLVRPALLKRSAVPVNIPYMDADSLFNELQELDNFDDALLLGTSTESVEEQPIEDTNSAEENEQLLDDILNW